MSNVFHRSDVRRTVHCKPDVSERPQLRSVWVFFEKTLSTIIVASAQHRAVTRALGFKIPARVRHSRARRWRCGRASPATAARATGKPPGERQPPFGRLGAPKPADELPVFRRRVLPVRRHAPVQSRLRHARAALSGTTVAGAAGSRRRRRGAGALAKEGRPGEEEEEEGEEDDDICLRQVRFLFLSLHTPCAILTCLVVREGRMLRK